MKLYAVLIFDEDHNLIYTNYNLDDFYFFVRNKIEDTVKLVSTELIKYVKLNSNYKINETIENNKFVIYGITTNKFYIAITNEEYPQRVAFTLLDKLKNSKFNKSEFDNLFNSYKDANEIDTILKLKNELNETKLILLDSIDKVIDRGENMDELLKKAEGLNETSTLLRRKTKDMNSCCIIF